MLHDITPDGTTIQFHCVNPTCDYHNCAGWDAHMQCAACDTVQYITIPAETVRESIRKVAPYADLSSVTDAIVAQPDTGMRKSGRDVVALPACECGTRMFVRVNFTDEEKNNPHNGKVPIRHPNNPNEVTGFFVNPAFERHEQFATKLKEIGNTYKESN